MNKTEVGKEYFDGRLGLMFTHVKDRLKIEKLTASQTDGQTDALAFYSKHLYLIGNRSKFPPNKNRKFPYSLKEAFRPS